MTGGRWRRIVLGDVLAGHRRGVVGAQPGPQHVEFEHAVEADVRVSPRSRTIMGSRHKNVHLLSRLGPHGQGVLSTMVYAVCRRVCSRVAVVISKLERGLAAVRWFPPLSALLAAGSISLSRREEKTACNASSDAKPPLCSAELPRGNAHESVAAVDCADQYAGARGFTHCGRTASGGSTQRAEGCTRLRCRHTICDWQ